jgi:hypothetical protein
VRGAAQRDTVSKNKNNNEIILFLIFKNIIVLPFCITVLPFVSSISPSQPVAQTFEKDSSLCARGAVGAHPCPLQEP